MTINIYQISTYNNKAKKYSIEMEDIRFNSDKKKLQNSIMFSKFLNHLKRNWWKYLIVLILLFIIIFPTLSGHLLGSWWNNFATSFLNKLTY